ncbi:hypothetical protein PAMP_011070 [Pampus punctatissimus]
MGEVIKSGVVATFPLQGEVQSQPREGEVVVVGGGGDTPCNPPTPLSPSLPLSLHQVPTPCLGSLGLGGGQGSRRQPLDSALRESYIRGYSALQTYFTVLKQVGGKAKLCWETQREPGVQGEMVYGLPRYNRGSPPLELTGITLIRILNDAAIRTGYISSYVAI